VLAAFEAAFGADAPLRRNGTDDGKGRANLRAAVVVQLGRLGVPPDRVDLTDRCTWRDADEFYSHRRDNGVTGRMAALIAPTT
jgi:copper oxidase (laccase) domain-containing protein